jgi:hypothetical protein
MKKTLKIITSIIILLLNISCENQEIFPSPNPEFSIKYGDYGDIVLKNNSTYNSYTIDWGDGNIKNLDKGFSEIFHGYENDGNYTLKVTAKRKLGKSGFTSEVVKITNTKGTFVIYLNKKINDNYLNFYIDNVYVGAVSSYITSSEKISCDNKTLVNGAGFYKDLKPGKHTYRAVSANGTYVWSDNFTISNKGCVIRALV